MKTLRNFWFLGKISWQANPWATVLAIISLPVSLMASMQSVAVGILVAGALSGDVTVMAWAGFLLVFALCVGPVLELLRSEAITKQRERLAVEFDAWVSALDGLQTIVSITGVLIVAFAIDWRLSLIALASCVNLLGPVYFKRWDKKADEESAPAGRALRHLMDLSTEVRHGAELRVFSMRSDILGRIYRHSQERALPRFYAVAKRGVLGVGMAIVVGIVAMWVLYSMSMDAITGTLGVPQMAAALALLTQLTWMVGQAVWTISYFVRTLQVVEYYTTLERYGDSVRAAHGGSRDVPDRLTKGIELRDVDFTYPGAELPTLKAVNLTLPAGSVVAVVGENGSGKTTLVNTVVGLYNREGEGVFIDGTPMSDFNVEELRAAMTGSFQDHARLEFVARDEIGSGHLKHRENPVAVEHAAHRAGADHVLATLPSGLDTQLGGQWPDGQDLSGGQWQRLSLARGFMRNTPIITILDEPTSALDATAEHDLFDRYIRAANASRERGGVTILVTHRFSTVRQADLVVVMRGGEVFETGSHAELMAKDGYYAKCMSYRLGVTAEVLRV